VDCDTSSLDESSRISDTLYGLFLEDINFAVDGGLYAELIKNRSFEYGNSAANGGMHGWVNTNKDILTFEIYDGSEDDTCLNANNTHYAILTNNGLSSASPYDGIYNTGYLDGLAVKGGESYTASFYIKSNADYEGLVRVALEDADGTVYAEAYVDSITDSWRKCEVNLVPSSDKTEDLYFSIEIGVGSVCLDMVSLMPADTYAGLPIRKDIGEYLEALNPSFLRFPGGCVIEGKDVESIYSWKDSIGNGLEFDINGETTVGDVAARPQGKDIWSGTMQDPYYTTYGIGFYEYFELCEALDCLPVPVLNAGMTCEVQSPKYIVYDTDSDEFAQYVQDALDLVEFCKGGADTYWGSIRIAMGHEEPFTLKYIAIGNEQWQNEYHEHYEKFVEAFSLAAEENPTLYGDIELIVANGTASGSTEGWSYLKSHPDTVTGLVDEHYYEAPTWFLTNTKRYDAYERTTQAKVFLGEYAAQSNTLEAALSEAAYMTGLERNGDIVQMACYAPLFGNSKSNQWTPDMMFFSNDSIYGTTDYYVQQMFSNNVGTMVLSSSLAVGDVSSDSSLTGTIGLGSWMTSVAYDNLTVTSNVDGSTLYSCDFENEDALDADGWETHTGQWAVTDGWLVQKNTGEPTDTNTGDAIYIGDTDWNNYTLTVDAKILGGNEGFLIPVCVEDAGNNIFWNIGGWSNTVSCLQIVSGGAKSGQVSGTVKNLTLKQNQTYQLKVVVDGANIKCYIDDALYVDYTKESAEALYETASVDENGDIILKLVNTSGNEIEIQTALKNFDAAAYESSATVTVLAGESLSDVNSFAEPEKLIPAESSVDVSDTFTYTAPKYSVSIIRIPVRDSEAGTAL
jgi:alpha-L-arabinofuranosidase